MELTGQKVDFFLSFFLFGNKIDAGQEGYQEAGITNKKLMKPTLNYWVIIRKF